MDHEEIKNQAESFDYAQPQNEVEFNKNLDLLLKYLLFETKWDSPTIRQSHLLDRIPHLQDLPLVCKAKECEYALKCPIMRKLNDRQQEATFIGTECRADKIFAVEQFVAFVKDLSIDPEQTTDVVDVANLIRLLILKRRIDWTLAVEGLTVNDPALIWQKDGTVHRRLEAHPLLRIGDGIEKQIQAAKKQLMAGRASRAEMAGMLGKSGVDILKDLWSGKLNVENDALPLKEDSSIEAEFKVTEEDVLDSISREE